jgi:hypothetical protein
LLFGAQRIEVLDASKFYFCRGILCLGNRDVNLGAPLFQFRGQFSMYLSLVFIGLSLVYRQ